MPRLPAVIFAIALMSLPSPAQDRPLPPQEAARHMTVPDGFHVTLFAGEPDVVQPIAFTFDDRGRLWVVECYSYPHWTKQKEGRDRVLIFEDTDGDGKFDKRTVFWDKGANLSGIQLGFGGVWLCSTPNLIFLPDRDGDDRPDGPPEIVLDGWNIEKAQHNVFNALTWGPDGWLYGCNGIQSASLVGKPGTPDKERVAINCGVWRYHPTRRVFEAVAHGTTNPWGLDFDDSGEMFITNCVIDHLWHVVPGGHYERMYGQDYKPHVYQLMKSCCDHIHWGGGHWTNSRGGEGANSAAGGGHAHVGCMVYLGDNWPAEYRNHVLMCNLHGRRLNNDVLERHGSGYVAHHGQDFLFARDPWFRGLGVQYGPDGGVYVTDWTDTGECHNYEVVDATNGRIFKVVYGTPKLWHGDLAKLSDRELVRLQLHPNDWFVRHARRLLQERAAAKKLDAAVVGDLLKMFREHPDVTRRLRALWALEAVGSHDSRSRLASLLTDSAEAVRAWAVRLMLDQAEIPAETRDALAHQAAEEKSPRVRLALASGLQRLPSDQRWPIAENLLHHAEDAGDAMIPLMLWYGVEPLAPADPTRALDLLVKARIPLVRELLARRLASLPGPEAESLRPLIALLAKTDDTELQRDILRGVQEALHGRRLVAMPDGWSAAYTRLTSGPSAEVRERALALAVQFGDARAFAALRHTVGDTAAAPETRCKALDTLLQSQRPDLLPLLDGLLDDRDLRAAAVRGLAVFGDPGTPAKLLERYAAFPEDVRRDVVATLASRPAFALALLDAVERGAVPRDDVSAYTVRQLQGLRNREVNARLAKVWGTARATSQEKKALIAKYKALLSPDDLKAADRARGRLVFGKQCASCHRLFDDGGRIGPDLTGSQRANLDYVLENVLDPNAVVPKEYQVTRFVLTSGRVLEGVVPQEDARSVTVQTPTERLVVAKEEIESREQLKVSLMPEGLLETLSREEVRDLIAYLAGPAQVPVPVK